MLFGALALFFSFVGSGSAQWTGHEVTRTRTIARVIASAGVRGHLLDPVCDAESALEPAPEGLFTYAVVRAARAPDRPMVLDAGGLLAPHGVLRFASERDPAAVAEMVDALGYRALAFGLADLGAPRAPMLAVAHELRARRIAMIATNLRCVDEALPLCDVLVDASDGISMHRVLDAQVAVLSLLDEDTLEHVAPDLAAGLRIEPVEASLEGRVQQAHAAGADIVIAILDVSVDRTLSMLTELPVEARPDVVILSNAGDELFSARPPGGEVAIVAPAPGDAAEIIIRNDEALRTSRTVSSEPLAMRGISSGEPVLDLADDIGDAYCAAWGHTLQGAHLAEPIDAAGIARLAAQIARERAGADVAVLNVGAVDATWRPSREDALTESDVYVALQYDEPLVVADVSRAWIEALAHHAAAYGLVTPGLDIATSEVGGRGLVTRASYRVVTLRFLASGGDSALEGLDPRDEPDWQPLGETATLRSVVRDALSRRDTRDPRAVRQHEGDTPEWLLTGSLDGTFAGSSISNPGYDVASLNRSSTVSLGLEVNLGASASAPDWTWDNTFVTRYRTQWSPSSAAGTSGAFSEAIDQIQLRSTGAWRGLFRGTTRSHAWYVPDPYIEAFVESEVTQPGSRNFHWLLVRPLLGLRFTLMPELDIKFDAGFQTQALAWGLLDPAGQPEGTVDGGLGVLVTLRPWDLLRDGDRHTTLSGTADFFWSDPLTRNLWQLRGQIDAQIDIAGPFSITLGVRLYLQQDRQVALGAAVDATAGIRVSGIGRVVGP